MEQSVSADAVSGFRRPCGAVAARRAGLSIWAVACAVSLALFCLVAAQLDWRSLAAVGEISWPLAGAGVALFVGENLFSAVRMHWLADGSRGFLTAMRVTAWHAVWLIALPMRLGEIAWIAAMRRAYGWNAAEAAACAAVQRLLDMAVVAAFILLTIPPAFGFHDDMPAFSVLAAATCILALAGAATLHVWLRLAAGLAVGIGRPRGRGRRFLRGLNQARRWLENSRRRRVVRRCIAPTVFVWAAVIAAYCVLGQAIGLDIALPKLGFAAAGGNLAAAVPVPSVGGIGLLEAGFTGIAAGFGAPAATAALTALLVRLASPAAVGLFWIAAAAGGRKRSLP